MSVRIAIPVPSSDLEYNERSLAPYLAALRRFGAEPVVIPVAATQDEIAQLITSASGVLLPGSRFDVDPERYSAVRVPECGPADPWRNAVDELLLQEAFSLRKPVLAICYGCQSLNVWCGGTLEQHLTGGCDHRLGREIVNAHTLQIDAHSVLCRLSPHGVDPGEEVNSTHHQAISLVGGPLQVAALSPADGVIEAVEGRNPDHFVLGVQWHPERTFDLKELSKGIFSTFVDASSGWQEKAQEQQKGASNGK